jgi:hypothetical protein
MTGSTEGNRLQRRYGLLCPIQKRRVRRALRFIPRLEEL